MTRSFKSSSSKKQVEWVWSDAEDRDLLEACRRFGGQWNEVGKLVRRSKTECMERWDVIMPLDWKSFSTLRWSDEDVLRLIQAVRSNQYDHDKCCFVSTKNCDWFVVAAIMNEDVWRWNANDCEQMWYELKSAKPFRLGGFTKSEDDILAERVIDWGADQKELWRCLSDILKRNDNVLRNRWHMISGDYVNFQSAQRQTSAVNSFYGKAQLSDLGLQNDSQAQSGACNSLTSSQVSSDLLETS